VVLCYNDFGFVWILKNKYVEILTRQVDECRLTDLQTFCITFSNKRLFAKEFDAGK